METDTDLNDPLDFLQLSYGVAICYPPYELAAQKLVSLQAWL